MSRTVTTSTSTPRLQLQGTLSWPQHSAPQQILVDLGADDSFLDLDIVSQAQIPVLALSPPKDAFALDG